MTFFNIDQHVSVNSNIEYILKKLGHSLEIISLSQHHWVMNRERFHVPFIEENIHCLIEKEKWQEFYTVFKHPLASFDGFIVCHPPIFAVLYKNFVNKPIIVQISIRYDFPYTDNLKQLKIFNDFLLSDSVIITANNKLDKAYFEDRTDGKKECKYIPSLCEYTNMTYKPQRNEFLLYDNQRQYQIKDTVNRHDLPDGHKWVDIGAFKGIIHIPYNISTMSFFEQYTACIPLFFPSKKFLLELYYQGARVLDQCFWSQEQHGKYGSQTMDKVLDLADFYSETFPHVIMFDSIQQLEDKLHDNSLLEQTTGKMEEDNKEKVYTAWKDIMSNVDYKVKS